MAKLFPPYFDSSTSSAAEKRLFSILKDSPESTDWVVLHSLGLMKTSRGPYGEIDFVVLIPFRGVLCLEVKGGRVACRNGEWETIDRNNRTARLAKSPFMQARAGSFALRDYVKTRAETNAIWGYGVVFPDIPFEEKSTEWEEWQVLDGRSFLDSIPKALLKMMEGFERLHNRKGAPGFNADAIGQILKIIRPDFERIVAFGTQIGIAERRILQLTEDQFESLDLFSSNPRSLFIGPAGTGKTMLALEAAKRAACDGKKVLLLCFNRLLGEWLTQQAGRIQHESIILAGSIHRLLRRCILASELGREFLKQESALPPHLLFEDFYPTMGKEAILRLNEQYDVVIVDEAQDLMQGKLLAAIDAWLSGGLREGHWVFFGDLERQAINPSSTGKELLSELRVFRSEFPIASLRRNCRNTRKIGEEAALLSGFPSLPYRLANVDGPPVNYGYYSKPEEQAAFLDQLVAKLLDDKVPSSDIVVISPLRLEKSGVRRPEGFRRFHLEEIDGLSVPAKDRPVVRYSTIHAFKGMEAPVVIISDIGELDSKTAQSLIYVGMTRARSHLAVFLDRKVESSMRARLMSLFESIKESANDIGN